MPDIQVIQISTAITDALLAASSGFGVWFLRRRGERYASSGLICVCVAATIGTLRFAAMPELASLHQFASSLAGMVGLPLIGLQYLSTSFGVVGREGRLQALGVLLVGYAALGLAFPIAMYRTLVGGFAMVVVLVAGAQRFGDEPKRGAPAMIGAVLTVIAGVVIGTKGTLAGNVLAIDVFHVLLAISHLCLAIGLPRRYDRDVD